MNAESTGVSNNTTPSMSPYEAGTAPQAGLSDASCCSHHHCDAAPFDTGGAPGLTYYLPAPSKPHTVLHIPGSHTLYVGPNSCTRRHCIHARQHGDKRNVSFLFVTQADVISGRYEDLIVEGIGELAELLDPSPRIFIIAVFCIDDFLGTDEDALLERLAATYPTRQFGIDHIDPVSLSEVKHMGIRKHKGLYSFIQPPTHHDRGVNFLGNFVSLDPDCDFLTLLADCNAGPVRELFTCKTHDDYQAMGQSCLSIVMRAQAQAGAADLYERLGVPYFIMQASYDAHVVADEYRAVAALLGNAPADLDERLQAKADAALDDAHATAQLLDRLPIAIDSSASLTCFATAKALLGYGFNVRHIFRSNHSFKLDPDEERFIRENHPEITVTRAKDFSHLYGEALGASQDASECLAIGSDGARVLRAAHFADVWHDEGFFGFQGIHKLMAVIRAAYAEQVDWSQTPELGLGRNGKERR